MFDVDHNDILRCSNDEKAFLLSFLKDLTEAVKYSFYSDIRSICDNYSIKHIYFINKPNIELFIFIVNELRFSGVLKKDLQIFRKLLNTKHITEIQLK